MISDTVIRVFLSSSAARCIVKELPYSKILIPEYFCTKLSGKNQTVTAKKALTIRKAQGSVTYKKKSGAKKITIHKKTGVITVKKGLKKGTYLLKVGITAAGNSNFKKKTVTAEIKIIVG